MIKKIAGNCYYIFYSFKVKLFDILPRTLQNTIINYKLKKTLKIAYKKVDYYHEKWSEQNIKIKDIKTAEDLDQLPVLEKSEVSKDYTAFLNKKAGFYFQTSGSSGKPVTILYTYLALIRNIAFSNRQRKVASKYTSGKKIFIVRPIPEQTSYKLQLYSHQILWIPHFKKNKNQFHSILEPVSNLYDIIQKEKAKVVGTYGSFINDFVAYCENNNLKPKYPKLFVYSSDVCDNGNINFLDKIGINVLSNYNCVESMVLAYQKNTPGALHIHEDAVIVRITKNNEVLLTNLYNDGTVLINYKVGDVIELENDEIVEIKGRSACIITPHGRNVHSVTLDPAFMKPGLYGYQIIQDKNKIELNLICDETQKENYKADVINFFESLGFKDIGVHFVNQLQREKNGKVILIKQIS